MKIRAFWDVALYSLIGVDVSEVHTALVMEAVRTSTPTRLHGATSQKALIFILATVIT
jgi:hypothetical protein